MPVGHMSQADNVRQTGGDFFWINYRYFAYGKARRSLNSRRLPNAYLSLRQAPSIPTHILHQSEWRFAMEAWHRGSN